MSETDTCYPCGKRLPIALLDGKPRAQGGKKTTNEMLRAAADRGEDFDIVECQKCYGPAWEKLKE